MPKRNAIPAGAPCWADLASSDPDKSRDFYRQIFGWEAEEPNEDMGGYSNFTLGGERVAGSMRNTPEMGGPDGWTTYLKVDDISATADLAASCGGTVVMPPMEVADLGHMAVVTDPGGAVIGVWQPGTHKGFAVEAEHGAPAWFELHTTQYDASLGFYRDVFGWDIHTVSDDQNFRYSTFGGIGDQKAGIMDETTMAADGGPPSWALYFHADDTEATLAKVAQLGGTVLNPVHDTPYGRLGVATDPTGAEFRLVQPNEPDQEG